ncbi:MAG: ABC transporter ATP-binding protein [Cyanobacteria bacterium P01_D01_bin.123]
MLHSSSSRVPVPATPAIQVSHVVKRFAKPRSLQQLALNRPVEYVTVLHDVSFEVSAGEVFGILGTNGAGNTTLTKILCTMVLPDGGSACVSGFDVTRHPLPVRRSVGYVTCADRSFEERISARANLEFFGVLNDLRGRALEHRIDEVLEQVGLKQASRQQVRSYSTGMKQKLAIARALMHTPQILFLDEPTSGLDPMAAEQFRSFLARLAKEQDRTIFLCTHMPTEIEQLCDRVLFLHRGHSVASGTLQSIRQQVRPARQFRVQVLADPPFRPQQEIRPGVRVRDIRSDRDRPGEWQLAIELEERLSRVEAVAMLQYLIRDCGLPVVECGEVDVSLADLYAALAVGGQGDA